MIKCLMISMVRQGHPNENSLKLRQKLFILASYFAMPGKKPE